MPGEVKKKKTPAGTVSRKTSRTARLTPRLDIMGLRISFALRRTGGADDHLESVSLPSSRVAQLRTAALLDFAAWARAPATRSGSRDLRACRAAYLLPWCPPVATSSQGVLPPN